VVYQRWIGIKIKSLTHEEKIHNLPRVKWVSAFFVSSISSFLALILHQMSDAPAKLLTNTWWLSWISAAAYMVICLIFYNVILETSCRKDALIPAKRHSAALLCVVPPVVILYQIFLSNEALVSL